MPGENLLFIYLCNNDGDYYLSYSDFPIMKKERPPSTESKVELEALKWRHLFGLEVTPRQERAITLASTLISDKVEAGNAPFFFDIDGDGQTDIMFTSSETTKPLRILLQDQE